MADRPIIFSGAMVRKILREIAAPGTGKTQTRRVLQLGRRRPDYIGPRGCAADPSCWGWEMDDGGFWLVQRGDGDRMGQMQWSDWAGAHAPGDRLWVREMWADDAEAQFEPQRRDTYYRADPGAGEIAEANRSCGIPHAWRPSIHMHRWRSRLTLIVTDVRVQRLQEISEADALAEGVEGASHGWRDYQLPATQCCGTARDSFRTLWDSLNAERAPWGNNPWVVAITFRPVLGNIDRVAE